MRARGILLSALLLLLSTTARAELTARWLGVAGLSISDGTTTLLFDPVFTKPSLRHWLWNSVFRSDRGRVEAGLAAAGIQRADAVFASHCHFDHASDIGRVSERTGATVFGGPSLEIIALGDPEVRARFRTLTEDQPLEIGRFRVIPYRRDHSPILRAFGWKFLPGPVPKDFHYEFYGYREGETWGYRVEHPEGRILIDQSSQWRPRNAAYAGNTDVYFVGVANQPSFDHLLNENIRALNAKRVIPLHFDLFFFQSEAWEGRLLPGIRLDQLEFRLNGASSPIAEKRFLIPAKYEPIRIAP